MRVPAPGQHGDVLFMQAGKKHRAPAYALHFEVRDGDRRMEASLPLGLAQSAERFLPRQMRPFLQDFDVDINELLEVIRATGTDDLPQFPNLTLFEMRDGDKSIEISVQSLGT